MAGKNSPLLAAAMELFEGKSKSKLYRYEFEIHIGDEIVKPLKLVQLEYMRDYPTAFGDFIMLSGEFYETDYTTKVYANRDNLLISLYRYPTTEDDKKTVAFEEATVQVFQANLVDASEPKLATGGADQTLTNTGSNDMLLSAQFQLIDRGVEKVRMIATGTILKNTDPLTAMKSLVGHYSEELMVDDKASVSGVEMVDPDVTDKRNHWVIPQGVRLVDLPNYLQNKCGGVYTKEIGSYLQDGIWYIYPVFDISRYDTAKRSMDIYLIPTQVLPTTEVTFMDDGSTLTVIATGGVKQEDPSDRRQLNEGNGTRFVRSDALIGGFSKTEGNLTIVDSTQVGKEFVTKERASGLNNVQFNSTRMTDNSAKVMSSLASRMGQYMQVAWDNSVIDLVIPGMPVRLFYEQNEEIIVLYGVVLNCQHDYHLMGKGLYNERYRVTTGMTLFLGERVET